MRSSIFKIIALVAVIHIVIVGLFVSTPMFCSQPAKQTSLDFPMTTIKQMEKINVNAFQVSNIILQGHRLSLDHPSRSLYMCKMSGVGVVVNEITYQIVSVMKEPEAYELLVSVDSATLKKRIRYQ